MAIFPGRSRTITDNSNITTIKEQTKFTGKNFLNRIFNTSTSQHKYVQLDEIIDLEKDVDFFRQNSLKLLNPKILYNVGKFSFNEGLYIHNREVMLEVKDSEFVTIDLVSQEAIKEISKRYKYIHLGLIVIGIKGMIMKGKGCKIMLIIHDDRWSEVQRKIIALTEVDLNENRVKKIS